MFKAKIKSDSGAAATIEMIFIILLIFMIVMTSVDLGMFFSSRMVIANAAQNGARMAAVYGGAKETPISRKYLASSAGIDSQCRSFSINDNIVACSVYHELKNSKLGMNIVVKAIKCGPDITQGLGDRTWCEITYDFKPTPGSGLSFTKGLVNSHVVKMTAETEVIHK